MFVNQVTSNEVVNIIKSLKNSSAGWDGIHAKVVEPTVNAHLSVLIHLFNLSLLQGVFPDELKIARVTPLFRSDNSMLVNNYRPLSVLPLFSKVLERPMYNRLLSFINK